MLSFRAMTTVNIALDFYSVLDLGLAWNTLPWNGMGLLG